MTRLRINTPSRLHFGLLGWGPHALRQFGGVGLMIENPGIEMTAEPSDRWSAEGPLAERTVRIAESVASRLAEAGHEIPPARLRIVNAPREHVGLGVGTQLSLAVARTLCAFGGEPEPTVTRLAELSHRGLRSGIGLHGFAHGGLIVDGGHRTPGSIPPLVARLEFPTEWTVLVVLPEIPQGRHGTEEVHAFAQLPPIPERLSERLCRLVLLGLLPAVVERDLPTFGACLTELQERVGGCFAAAQGGIFAHPQIEAIVHFLTTEGIQGAGQSSWGPAIYGFTDQSEEERANLVQRLHGQFEGLGITAFWTTARNAGASLEEANTSP